MSTFQEDLKRVQGLIASRKNRWQPAYKAANQLVIMHPNELDAWFTLHLASNLVGNRSRAQEVYDFAKSLPTFDRMARGNFERDVALALIRTGKRKALEEAKRLVKNIRDLHKDSPDHLNCLLMVEGRLRFAEGMLHLLRCQPLLARNSFRHGEERFALAEWCWLEMLESGQEINHQWRFNNAWHRYLCLVMIEGVKSHNLRLAAVMAQLLDGMEDYGQCHWTQMRLIGAGGRAAVSLNWLAITQAS